ncbi:hypothetical protein [Thomasclavelia cocleata]|jgi:hypothetical protein|uniref:hypothetical protein n=1 Tax=Thomasclavelia cocleata TaxID=69824 RepID=UPI00241FECFD|nr:hypothetical protein [Thomasclavelia cocleata]MCI9629678.1 hypothetical protein [Thomasclavelia cocleata]
MEDLDKLFELIIKIEKELDNSSNSCFNEEMTLMLKIINCECNYIVLLNDYIRLQKSKYN